MCNAYANKWDEHVNFDFSIHSIPTSGTNEPSPHGLLPVNLADLPENPTEDEEREFNAYSRLVSNRFMKDMLKILALKPTSYTRKIKKTEWKPSLYETNVYSYKIDHGLGTEYIGVSMFHEQERFNNDGVPEKSKAIFSGEDIYILDENTIEINVTQLVDVEVLIFAHTGRIDDIAGQQVDLN